MRTSSLLVVICLWCQPASAGPGLQLCKDGPALGGQRLAYPAGFSAQLPRLRHNLPALERALRRLDQGACVPAGPAIEALLAPVAPLPVEVDPASLEARVLRAWQRAWRDKEAVAAGQGAFLLLGQGPQWRNVAPGNPKDLEEDLRLLARRARPAGPDAEVLALPCLVSPADEGLHAQAERAARAFADGHARQRAHELEELGARAQAVDLELLEQALGLARAAGELAGAVEELARLAELGARLARARRPAPEHARLEAALAARRGEAEQRCLTALGALGQLAGDRLARQQELARLQAERRVLAAPGARLVVFPVEPLPRRTEPRQVALLRVAPGGDPREDGLSLVLTVPVEEKAAKPGARPGGKPRPSRRSRLKLEEEGVERTPDGLRPADGRAPPPADAAVAARASDRQACEMDNAPACYRLGLACAHGSGGPRDPVAAQAALDKACDGGFALGCHQLGLFMESGALGAIDRDRARAYLGRACRDGLQKACAKLGR